MKWKIIRNGRIHKLTIEIKFNKKMEIKSFYRYMVGAFFIKS